MSRKCGNCGGKLYFSPKDKANVCENCGSIVPIEYKFSFNKKPFEEQVELSKDELADSLTNIRCESCGASVMLSKFQLRTNCPYCGSSMLKETKKNKLLYIDYIVPFVFDKQEALKKLKLAVKKDIYADSRILKNISIDDVESVYVNAFVFDVLTNSAYRGVLSYTRTTTDSEGSSTTEVIKKYVDGLLNKNFENVTVEANSNLTQAEMAGILPYDYKQAVEYDNAFLNGYMLEYQDKMFKECFTVAEKFIKSEIEKEILKKNNCTTIESLTLKTEYLDKKYNYCLLPVYFIKNEIKGKKKKVLINGQTGQVGHLPKSKWKVALSIIFGILFFGGLVALFMLL